MGQTCIGKYRIIEVRLCLCIHNMKEDFLNYYINYGIFKLEILDIYSFLNIVEIDDRQDKIVIFFYSFYYFKAVFRIHSEKLNRKFYAYGIWNMDTKKGYLKHSIDCCVYISFFIHFNPS